MNKAEASLQELRTDKIEVDAIRLLCQNHRAAEFLRQRFSRMRSNVAAAPHRRGLR